MNTNRLARQYDGLSPWERLPLIVAASARGDEAEKTRLMRSAPTAAYRMPDYFGLGDGLNLLSLFHLIHLLDLGALYWLASGLLEQMEVLHDWKETPEQARRLATTRLIAYSFVAHADAWRLLCAEMGIDDEVLLRDLPSYATVRHMEETARLSAFTPEEATDHLRRTGGDDSVEAVTAEKLAAVMREFLKDRVTWWDS